MMNQKDDLFANTTYGRLKKELEENGIVVTVHKEEVREPIVVRIQPRTDRSDAEGRV